MIPVTNLRTGACFTDGKDLFQVLSYEHIKLGRGTATIKLRTKNLRTGAIIDKTFISGAKVEKVILEKKEAQYLYQTKNQGLGTKNFFFMDPKTFEQFELSQDKTGESALFLKEGMMVKILFYGDEPINLELPIKMEFTVAETGPGVRGDSATNIFKDAILENGLKVRVPLFVKTGERVVIDTRTREYVGRVNKY